MEKMNKVRILFNTPGPLLGGGATVSLFRLIKHLNKRYEPIVLCNEANATNPYVTKLQELGVEVLWLKDTQKTGMTIQEKRAQKRGQRGYILEQLANWKRRHPLVEKAALFLRDLKEIFIFDLPRCCSIVRIIKQRKIRLVHLNNGVRSHRGAILAAKWTGIACICHVRIFDKFKLIDLLILKFIDYFVYMSNALEAHIKARWTNAPGSVVYDGIELAQYRNNYNKNEVRAEFDLLPSDFVVGNIGRLVSWKGQEIFINALAEVVSRAPALKAMIVGMPDPGQESYMDELRALTASCGIENRVIFTGFRMDVPRLLKAMDVVVHSSTRPEPFGIVVIESMASGLPIIATRGGGPLDSIEDGIDGLLVPLKDPQAMAEAIWGLYNDPQKALKIGSRAKSKTMKMFSVERFAAEMATVFDYNLS
jgi:glycosyltransferase involved in cell wall biosynthesis